MTELRFDGRVAVITGAGRGLGRAYALLLASRGAKVVVNDIGAAMAGDGADESPAQEVVREIRAAGGDAVANFDTVGTPQGAEAIVQTALETYGRVDILIHNAGNVRTAPLTEMTLADFDSVLDVHLRGGFNVLKAAYLPMVKAGYGRVVMTSSVGALYGFQTQANYAAAKGGLIGLTNILAIEGAEHGVLANAIVPGAVTRMAEGLDTSFYPPMGPEMVAPLVAWLCHETCSITGEMLVSIAGRAARALITETPGVFDADWTIETIAEKIDAIRDASEPVVFNSQMEHIVYSCDMAKAGAAPSTTLQGEHQ